MNKDDVILLHTFFVQIIEYLKEENKLDSTYLANVLNAYNAFGVKPTQVYASKSSHKMALFLLGDSILDVMSYLEGNKSSAPKLPEPHLVSACIM